MTSDVPRSSSPTGDSTAVQNSVRPLQKRSSADASPSPDDERLSPSRQNTQRSAHSRLSTSAALRRKATWAALVRPDKKVGKQPGWRQSLKFAVTCTWLNVLLVFIPISWALHFVSDKVGDTVVFVTCMLAIIPLAKLLGEGTEELALRVGDTLGGLLNATLGNATELIIAILALVKCELAVVQSSLLGSILSNLLLVLGMCFFAGGIRFSEQAFSVTAAQVNSSLLAMSVIAILIPAGFHAAFGNLSDQIEGPDVLKMSRGIAVILLVVYGAYLTFQLFTHAHLYQQGDNATHAGHETWGGHKIMRPAKSVQPKVKFGIKGDTESGDAVRTGEDEESGDEPKMNTWAACILLVVATILIAFTSEWLVSSIEGLTASGALSEEWVGLILLPIVGNAAEHVTAVTTAAKDKLNISLGVAVGSSIQIALLVVPLLVVLAWMMGKPLTLLFDPFESIILLLAVLIVNYTTQDGRANWLEGFLLMNVYIIVAVAFFFYPANSADYSLSLVCS